MKRFSIALAVAAISMSAMAQTAPNRLFINNLDGYRVSSHVIDRLGDITFGRVDGEVKAEVFVNEVDKDKIVIDVIKSEECEYFKMDILPTNRANQYNDALMANLIESTVSTKYYEDYTDGQIAAADLGLQQSGLYTVVTVGYDKYETPVGVCRADFEAYSPAVTGNPKVSAKLINVSTTAFTVEFTPNADVLNYYVVAMTEGDFEYQWNTFGPMFGFSSQKEMIKMYGGNGRAGVSQVEWKDMDPNTTYDVYILPTDINGNYGDFDIFKVSTVSQGGSGDAVVAMKVADYRLADWGTSQNPAMLPSLFITFTPNDQTWRYRYGVYLASIYDENKDVIAEELRSDPPQPNMAYWWWFDELTTDFQVNENTEYVVVSAGMNADGKWGVVNELRGTTPAQAGPAKNAPAYKRAPAPMVSTAEEGAKAPAHRKDIVIR